MIGQLKNAQDTITRLESSLQQSSAKATGTGRDNSALEKEVRDLRSRAAQQQIDIEKLRSQLSEAQRKGNSAAGQTFPVKGTAGKDVNGPAKDVRIKQLEEENDKLRQELSAFDMDFFEEIETLKYAHAEALKKLRVYEAAGSRR